MNKMMKCKKNVKYIQNCNFPPTKLRNVFCTQCKHQFFFEGNRSHSRVICLPVFFSFDYLHVVHIKSKRNSYF